MGKKCAVKPCPNRKFNSGVTAHNFPKDIRKRNLWITFVEEASDGITNISNYENFAVCSLHFSENDYEFRGGAKRLKATAIPSNLKGNQVSFGVDKENEASCGPNGENTNLSQFEWESRLYAAEMEIKALRTSLFKSEEKVKNLECELQTSKAEHEKTKLTLSTVLARFTNGQQTILMNAAKKFVHWENDDIQHAFPLFVISSRAYKYVRDNWIPLPSPSLLYRHLSKMNIESDKPFPPVVSLLNANFVEENYFSLMTQCIVGLDEITVDPMLCYDPALDQIVGGKKEMNLYCARSLFGHWKFPVMYSSSVSKNGLEEVIETLFKNGLNVVGVTSDLGPRNRALWKSYGIGTVHNRIVQKSKFEHPMREQDIWWTPDLPHLIKLLRNHILDNSITLENGLKVDRSWFSDLINSSEKELGITPKLGQKHLYVRGQQRQNVPAAFQLLSHTTASAARVLLTWRPGHEDFATFIDLVNDFIDLLNTRIFNDSQNPAQSPYGKSLKEQQEILEKAKHCFSTMKVGNRRTLAPFQIGLIMLIESLEGIYSQLEKTVRGFECIMTSHLNQDYVENFFANIRGFGHHNSNPNAVAFRYRCRKLILLMMMKFEFGGLPSYDTLTRDIYAPFNPEETDTPALPNDLLEELEAINHDVDVAKEYSFESMTSEEKCYEGGKEYIAGYIARKLIEDFPQMSTNGANEASRDFWVATLSKGGLLEPSNLWLAVFSKFEDYFGLIHKENSFNNSKGVVKLLVDTLRKYHPLIPEDILKFYAKCRTKIRVKYLNKLAQDDKFRKQEIKHVGFLEGEEENELEMLSEVGENIMLQFSHKFAL